MAARLKIDENLPDSAAEFLRAAGHDVTSVIEEELVGAPDALVAEVCRTEQRALITLDVGLGDIRAYPPAEYHGIVVLRPRDQSVPTLLALLQRFRGLLEENVLVGALWIVDERRVRIRQ